MKKVKNIYEINWSTNRSINNIIILINSRHDLSLNDYKLMLKKKITKTKKKSQDNDTTKKKDEWRDFDSHVWRYDEMSQRAQINHVFENQPQYYFNCFLFFSNFQFLSFCLSSRLYQVTSFRLLIFSRFFIFLPFDSISLYS